MGKYKIGMLLGRPVVVGDKNIVSENEYYAEVDSDNDDITAIYQRGSRLTGKTDKDGFELVVGNRITVDEFIEPSSSVGGGARVIYKSNIENLEFSGVDIVVE